MLDAIRIDLNAPISASPICDYGSRMGLRTASYYFIVRRHMWSGNISTRRERVKSSTDEQFVAPCRVLARSHAAGRQARPSNMHHDVGVLLPPEIETDERVLIAQVEEAI